MMLVGDDFDETRCRIAARVLSSIARYTLKFAAEALVAALSGDERRAAELIEKAADALSALKKEAVGLAIELRNDPGIKAELMMLAMAADELRGKLARLLAKFVGGR